MDPMGAILLLLRPCMSYNYTGCMLGKTPQTKKTIPVFCENMDHDKWNTTIWYRVTRNP